jgi:hypothetical protein
LLVARSLHTLQSEHACCRLYNPTDLPVTLCKHTVVAKVTTLPNFHIRPSPFPEEQSTKNSSTGKHVATAEPQSHKSQYPPDTGSQYRTPNSSETFQHSFSWSPPLTSPEIVAKPFPINKEKISIANKLGISLDKSKLTNIQKEQLLTLIGSNRKLFATNTGELGRTDFITHKIETGDAKPQRAPFYRYSPEARIALHNKTKDLLEHDLIRPSLSAWSAPVVMIKKVDPVTGDIKWRLAVDYRHLNKCLVPEHSQLPTFDSVIDTLSFHEKPLFLTSLDMASSYWQLPLDPESAHKTTFSTPEGSFFWKVVPFGLQSSPSTQIRLMNRVLHNLNWKYACCFLDDVLLISSAKQTDQNEDPFLKHLSLIEAVFDRYKQANLTLNPAKCHFVMSELPYLGFRITEEGIAPCPNKVKAVSNFPTPHNIRTLRSFLGLAGFYRRYIRNFALIANPLFKLLRDDTKFEWDPECDHAFDTLKTTLTTAPVLAIPNWHKRFLLTTDAAKTGLSYCLSQKDDKGKERPIAFMSRATRPAEQRYSIAELEMLAIVEGCKAYHIYLATNEFDIITDCKCLKYIDNIRADSPSRLGKFALLIQGYKFKIAHRKGSLNKVADALSRRQHDQPPPDTPYNEELDPLPVPDIFAIDSSLFAETKEQTVPTRKPLEVTICYLSHKPAAKAINIDPPEDPQEINQEEQPPEGQPVINQMDTINLVQEQQDCPDFADMYAYLRHGILPRLKDKARKVLLAEDQYIMTEDGILQHIYQPRSRGKQKYESIIRQICVPTKRRALVLFQYHTSQAGACHAGVDRCYWAIRNKYYWPSCYANTSSYIKQCHECQLSKRLPVTPRAELHPLPMEGKFSRWHIDHITGLNKSKEGFQNLLVCIDSYTSWVEFFSS